MRTFIALMLNEDDQKKVAAVQQEVLGLTKKSTAVSQINFHITLSFLGNIDDDTVFALEDALDNVMTSPSIDIALNQIGTFKSNGAETLWVAPSENEQLNRLQKEVERIVESCGIGTGGSYDGGATKARNTGTAKTYDDNATKSCNTGTAKTYDDNATKSRNGENEHDFQAHITLARNVEFAGGKSINAVNEKLATSPIVVHANSFSLMQSTLGEGGPLYKEICAWE